MAHGNFLRFRHGGACGDRDQRSGKQHHCQHSSHPWPLHSLRRRAPSTPAAALCHASSDRSSDVVFHPVRNVSAAVEPNWSAVPEPGHRRRSPRGGMVSTVEAPNAATTGCVPPGPSPNVMAKGCVSPSHGRRGGVRQRWTETPDGLLQHGDDAADGESPRRRVSVVQVGYLYGCRRRWQVGEPEAAQGIAAAPSAGIEPEGLVGRVRGICHWVVGYQAHSRDRGCVSLAWTR